MPVAEGQKEMKLTKANYHSKEANDAFMSVSQFKTFLDCPERMVAEQLGIYKRDNTTALLVGSYVDAYFSEELPEFMEAHPEIRNSRTGELKSDYKHAAKIIDRARQDEFFMEFVNAPRKQQILTGWIGGHEWKVKIDALHEDKIVDFKVMRDMRPIYQGGEWKTFVDAWRYPLQGYVYREIVRQHVGKSLPFYLAVMTKEPEPDLAVIEISDWRLNAEEAIVLHYLDEYAATKAGEIEPRRCEKCDWCKRSKLLTKVTSYDELVEDMEV